MDKLLARSAKKRSKRKDQWPVSERRKAGAEPLGHVKGQIKTTVGKGGEEPDQPCLSQQLQDGPQESPATSELLLSSG